MMWPLYAFVDYVAFHIYLLTIWHFNDVAYLLGYFTNAPR